MFPEDFQYRISRQAYIDAPSLLKALEETSPVSIRINSEKWSKIPVSGKQVAWCRNGYYLEERPSFTLDPLFNSGCYYPQEASGMFLEEIFGQIAGGRTGIKVLDLCGAPGGKSTHLASLIGTSGLLVSNEVIRQRALILAENLTKWGLSNAIVTQSDPSGFTGLPGFFDLILVDAPCSGEGMFRDPVAVNEWTPENSSLCSLRQKRILMDAWPSLKEDGLLIYSTCTFNPGENEENIKWIAGKTDAESVRLDVSENDGITEIKFNGIYGYGFYPGRIKGEGLFYSILRKRTKESFIKANAKGENEKKLTRGEKAIADEWSRFAEENLCGLGDDIVAIPCRTEDFRLICSKVKVVKPGTRIFTVKKKNVLPSHELAMSVSLKREAFPAFDLGLSDALSYLQRENFSPGITEKSWNLVTYRGVNLGFVNNIGSRINNYYPVEWRIRMNVRGREDVKKIIWT